MTIFKNFKWYKKQISLFYIKWCKNILARLILFYFNQEHRSDDSTGPKKKREIKVKFNLNREESDAVANESNNKKLKLDNGNEQLEIKKPMKGLLKKPKEVEKEEKPAATNGKKANGVKEVALETNGNSKKRKLQLDLDASDGENSEDDIAKHIFSDSDEEEEEDDEIVDDYGSGDDDEEEEEEEDEEGEELDLEEDEDEMEDDDEEEDEEEDDIDEVEEKPAPKKKGKLELKKKSADEEEEEEEDEGDEENNENEEADDVGFCFVDFFGSRWAN